jgi:hypothetical protein
MADYKFGSPEFHEAVRMSGHKAFLEAIAAELPVFYLDSEGFNVMQQGGRIFEIRWKPGFPSEENYEIVRELTAHAA